jgi:hypothetical protein
MHYTGYLNFWFTDRPVDERIAPFVDLGIRHLNVFSGGKHPSPTL